jgi:membrane protease subunit HflC
MSKALSAGLYGIVGVLIVIFMSMFIVDQRKNAIVFRLGEVVSIKKSPGLYFKVPFLDNVREYDVLIRTIDTPEPQLFLTSEKKNVQVDLFIKWRIADVRQYYASIVSGSGGTGESQAQTRLLQTVNEGLRAEFGRRTVHDVVSGERDKIMDLMRLKASEDASKIGIEVLDVRLKRVDLPEGVTDSVYQRMTAERTRVANELRSTGSAESEKLRAEADKQKAVILAEAYRDAQKIKGAGDAKAAAIYAKAYEQNPEFYSFYRSLEAYKSGFKGKGDVLVLDPNSDFLKYFKSGGRAGK